MWLAWSDHDHADHHPHHDVHRVLSSPSACLSSQAAPPTTFLSTSRLTAIIRFRWVHHGYMAMEMKLLATTIMMYCYHFYITPANITQPVVHAAPVYTYPAYPDPCRFPMPHHSKPNQSYPLKSISNIHAIITTWNATNSNQTEPNQNLPYRTNQMMAMTLIKAAKKPSNPTISTLSHPT